MRNRGFTLIELIISIVVLSIVIFTSMTMLANISRMTVMPDVLNRCGLLAERELERVNQKRYSTIVNEGPTAYAMPGFTDYTFQIEVSPPPGGLGLGSDSSRIKQVAITVSHPVYGAVTLTTLVANS